MLDKSEKIIKQTQLGYGTKIEMRGDVERKERRGQENKNNKVGDDGGNSNGNDNDDERNEKK